jgi:HAE1 family hydrophobic/amphiphilic exporter-1
MNVSRRFIEYPVMTTLLMAALIIFGGVAYSSLPVSELPNVDFPTIQVNASLAGADPETVASTIAGPLENAFSTIPGIDSMTSSSVQGSVTITIQFALDRNIDAAGTDVQAAISSALSKLPKTMVSPPTFEKVNPTDDPVLFLVMSSQTLPLTIVDEYADTLLARQLSQVSGVAQVDVYGAAQYAVRVQADPAALVARGIGIDTLASGIQNSSVDQATGATNGPSDAQIIQTSGQLENAAGFKNQIIAYSHGAPVRLGDVAHVVDSVNNVRQGNWYRGQRAISIAIMRQPGSNTIEVVNNVKQVLPRFRASLPAAIQLSIRHDRSETIRASVNNVQETLLIAAALVVAVIFLFLRKLSATIIPSVTLPIAVIGTFAGMSLAGFSLDNLSLMALTLSVGFVVDDAIVMLENIVRHVEEGEKPYEAAMKGSTEIGFTILSMTVSLIAVFIPLVFMGGIVGRLLHEFAVTMMLAILVSGLVSVTLTPMLCARILKDERREKHSAFYNWSERSFETLQRAYDRSLRWSLAHKRIILALFALSVAASVVLFEVMPEDFLPPDDTGMLIVSIQAANGTSYERMVNYGMKVADIFNADPNVAGAMLRVGSNGAGSNGANISVMLKPLSERPLSAEDVARELRKKVANITGINVFVQNPPAIRVGGRSSRSTYQYTLQGMDIGLLARVSDQLTRKLQGMPGFVGVNSDFDSTTPSVAVKIDRDRAASLGVTPAQIETAMGYAFGGEQVTLIYGSTNQYQVILELEPRYQRNTASLKTLYVTASNGTLVPLSAVTNISQSMIPLSVNHSGGVPAVTISFDLAAGYSLSDAVSGIQQASAAIHVPPTVAGSFQGTAGAFQQSTRNMGLLLIMATIVVYIILGILYESFIHPLTILSGLPSAAVGALLTLWIVGMPITLYAFVGMIMLIGIVKKNAIMMIDFALQRQREDPLANAEQAIFEAALIRFRPIMMTTMAALMGTLPIAFGSGMGADSRRPLGICVTGGLLLSQLLTLYITPVIYTYLDRLGLYLRRRPIAGGHKTVPAE